MGATPFRLCILWAALLAGSAGAATIRDDQPDSSYLALAGIPDYACVGSFVNNSSYNGSATLIAPDWVLTAGHVFATGSSGTFTLNGTAYAADLSIVHPNWRNGNAMGGYDFALAHLATPVSDVAPATLYTGSSEMGRIATLLGFGMTGTGLSGQARLDYQKRGIQNVIDGNFGNPSILLGTDFDNPHSAADNDFGDATPLTLEGSVAPGDSGGGVFLTIDSQTYLAGVISFVAAKDGNPNADYGDVNGFGRVSAVAPWILSNIPEPSPSGLLLVAGFAWRFLRRRG